VVIRNNQGIQAIHTGSGDIHQDNRTGGQGSLYIGDIGGDVLIGVRPEDDQAGPE